MKPPWSEAERLRIIADAIEFIRKKRQEASFDLAMQVGKHLYEGLLRSDPRLVRSGGAWKTDSFRRIASDERVGESEQWLAMSVHAYLAVNVFKQEAPGVQLPPMSPWEWARLQVPLEAHPEAVVELALWRQRQGVTKEMLLSAAQVVGPFLERGGKLSDVVPGTRGGDTPYDRIRRILGVIEGWLDDNTLTAEARKRALVEVGELIDAL
jgi:hypothetical protein